VRLFRLDVLRARVRARVRSARALRVRARLCARAATSSQTPVERFIPLLLGRKVRR